MSIVTQGYIIHTNAVVKSVKELVWDGLLSGLDNNTKHLFAHILKGHEINSKEDKQGWIPISSKLIEDKLRGANWKELVTRELIEVSSYSKVQGYSREYRVNPPLFEQIQNMRPNTSTEIINAHYYNLCNGKSLKRKKPIKTKYYDDNRNERFTDCQKKAIKLIKQCRVNRQEVDLFLDKIKNAIDLGSGNEKEILSYYHDLRCWEGIVRRKKEEDGNFIVYQSDWDSQTSGRITEIGGGLQNASRELKSAMIKDTGYINLDIKGSQVYGARVELESHGIDTSWFDYYQVNGKQKLAADIGISVDCWKGLLCSILMGGFPQINKKGNLIAKNMEQLVEYKCVRKYVCPEVGIEIEWDSANDRYSWIPTSEETLFTQVSQAFQIVKDVIKHCKPLIEGINEWHDLLFTSNWVSQSGSDKRPDFIATNKADGRLNLTSFVKKHKHGYKLKSEGKRKLAAHILQGKEAAFIHYITAFSGDEFTVVSNQHDGLIIEGEIPLELIHNARQFACLPYAELEEKSIV